MDDSPLGKDMAGIPDGRFMGPEAPYKGVQGDRAITWRPVYRADGELIHPQYGKIKWKPSVHMPKWAARIKRKVLRVWYEQIRCISTADCIAEGIKSPKTKSRINVSHGSDCDASKLTIEKDFMFLWESIYPGSWERNDWVECIEFEGVGK
jgi:hypothetical protein